MAWGSETPQTIIETVAGGGANSNWVQANPGEKIHFDVERIDTPATEPWIVSVEVTTDHFAAPARPSDPPIRSRRLLSDQLTPNLVVSGYYAYRIHVENDDSVPVDKVQVTVRYRRDGVAL